MKNIRIEEIACMGSPIRSHVIRQTTTRRNGNSTALSHPSDEKHCQFSCKQHCRQTTISRKSRPKDQFKGFETWIDFRSIHFLRPKKEAAHCLLPSVGIVAICKLTRVDTRLITRHKFYALLIARILTLISFD